MRLLLFFALVLSFSQAAAIETFSKKQHFFTDYEKALKKAKATDTLLMLSIESNHCPWCRKMERRTFKQKKVRTFIHKHFVPLILNRDTDTIPKAFQTPRTPTIFFIDPNQERLVWEVIGFKDKKAFMAAMKEALKSYKNRDY